MEVSTEEQEGISQELVAPDTKAWYQSKTVWASVVAIAAGVAAPFGYQIDAALQTEIANLIVSIVVIGGGSVALYGRAVATKKIG